MATLTRSHDNGASNGASTRVSKTKAFALSQPLLVAVAVVAAATALADLGKHLRATEGCGVAPRLLPSAWAPEWCMHIARAMISRNS